MELTIELEQKITDLFCGEYQKQHCRKCPKLFTCKLYELFHILRGYDLRR